MASRRAGAVKRWLEDIATRLMDDLSYDVDSWDQVFNWVMKNADLGDPYPVILKKAKKWDRRRQYGSIEDKVFKRFSKEEKEDVPPDFQGNPETHGIEEPRGGGFSIMQNLQKDLKKDEEKDEEKSRKGSIVTASVREAMYWCSPDRTYRLTKQEQEAGSAMCPKCKGDMENERFTRSERMYRCPECGFKIPSGKVTTKKVEIEIEPDGSVEVEVTDASDGEK